MIVFFILSSFIQNLNFLVSFRTRKSCVYKQNGIYAQNSDVMVRVDLNETKTNDPFLHIFLVSIKLNSDYF